MLLYWKFLLVLGTILWVALCLSDYIYSNDIKYNIYIFNEQPQVIKEKPSWLNEFLNRFIDLDRYISFCEDNYILLVLQWITLAIICSVVFYITFRVVKLIATYQFRKKVSSNVTVITLGPPEPQVISVPIPGDSNLKKSNSISKIPKLVTRHEAQSPITNQEGSCIVTNTQSSDENNKSCPNLIQNVSATKPKELFSLYDNKVNHIKSSQSVDRLRGEIVLLQATSFREQAILSRKLDAIVKEKRDLSIELANSLRENKNAKRKLEEIQRERSILIKQLESATREIKSNTKSKKLTLTRLEKAITESKEMKSEFARLNEEKKILEQRVISLGRECKEMKARRSVLNQSYSEIKQDYDGDVILDKTDEDSLTSGGYYEVTDKQLHQSNIDMNKVQIKLNDLEKSLEKLKFSSTITKERERSLQEQNSDNILSVPMELNNDISYDMIDENKIDEEEDDEEESESQSRNYEQGDAIAITSDSSLDIAYCQSLCLMPGCSREHNLCENPECVYEEDAVSQHSSPDRNLNSKGVTSTNQIILEAVKEKSSVLANKSSLFDTREARARLAAFFSVSLWKKKNKLDCNSVLSISDDKLSLDTDSQQTDFDYEDWSPRLVAPGIVTQSPAFQKFLSNVIVDQRNAMIEQNIRTG